MRRHPVVERLWDEVEANVQSLGYELVQMTFGGPAGNQNLTIYADKPGGISADDCATLAEHLSVMLDALDPISSPYHLIVSSPGLDRPLGRDEDFAQHVGQTLLVRYAPPEGRLRRARGRLTAVTEDAVQLETDSGPLDLPLAQIAAANLHFEWEEEGDN
ncbi:MAG TPA: ribosome maturation factor RimP [Armatimonadota bacterium]|jgi:ribosome maturation factor RimP